MRFCSFTSSSLLKRTTAQECKRNISGFQWNISPVKFLERSENRNLSPWGTTEFFLNLWFSLIGWDQISRVPGFTPWLKSFNNFTRHRNLTHSFPLSSHGAEEKHYDVITGLWVTSCLQREAWIYLTRWNGEVHTLIHDLKPIRCYLQ